VVSAAAPPSAEPVAHVVTRARGIVKTFRRGSEVVRALRGADLEIFAGEVVGISGASGSGKSTMLAVLCGWECPDSGEVSHADGEPAGLLWSSLALVPQTLGLLHDLTVRENIELPGRLRSGPRPERARADELMARLGLAHLQDRSPPATSVGEQQRTALARALYLRPALTLADEPTAHQDAGFAGRVLATIRRHADAGAAFLIVSHDRLALDACDRVLTMRDGMLS
jgi:putative ABC transport system ATP-binding protein